MSTTSKRLMSFSREAVQKRNASFAKMSPAQQRVTIARDVLAWLDLGKLKPRKGTYMAVKAVRENEIDTESSALARRDARDFITAGVGTAETCTACALGSMFACAVGRANKVNLYEFAYAAQEDMHTYLAPYFSAEQLYLIESAFECAHFGEDALDWEDAKRAMAFGHKFMTTEDWLYAGKPEGVTHVRDYYELPAVRLRAIMKNIIANRGEFIP